jgi:hypothetical protein
MALGNLLYEEKGKQLSARTVDLVEQPQKYLEWVTKAKYEDVI